MKRFSRRSVTCPLNCLHQRRGLLLNLGNNRCEPFGLIDVAVRCRDVTGNKRGIQIQIKQRAHPGRGHKRSKKVSIEPPAANPSVSLQDKKLMSELLANGMLRGVIFATDDCDATFEQVCRAGVEVLQEPMDQDYGVRDCAFRDPSGNIVRFSQKR